LDCFEFFGGLLNHKTQNEKRKAYFLLCDFLFI